MKISRSFALYVVMLGLVLLGAASAWSQTDFNIKVYITDGSGWTDSVYIGKYAAATDAVGDSLSPVLNETELPPLPPSGSNQAPDIRLVDPLGGGAYGQGVRVDLRNLVSDEQSNTYRLAFRRTDPEGSGVTLSWDAGLAGVSGGGFYLTDGFGGVLFSPVDMAAQTSFTFAGWATLSGGFADIKAGTADVFRTFTSVEIATGLDSKGKKGKLEKAKPISVDFEFQLTATGGETSVFLSFDKLVEGYVSFSDGNPVESIPGGLKVYTITPDVPLAPGCIVTVTGNGNKGKVVKTKYGFAPANVKAVTAVVTYTFQTLRLPQPNINNIGNEMYLAPGNLSLGVGAGVGLPGDLGTNAKGKLIFHHISLPKWKDVSKTLYKFKNVDILMGGPDGDTTTPAFCLDTIKSKENLKVLKSIGPDKMMRVKDVPPVGNRLVAEMIALKFNMGASALGHVPATTTEFRDLIYTNPGHPFNGKTVDQIADSGDYALACWGGLPAGWSNSYMAQFLRSLNEEFSDGVFDTVSWSGIKTIATGVKPLALSSIFTSGGPSNTPVAPVDYSELYDVPETFSLSQNYPNPFNPTTTIEFSIPEDAVVTLQVYNMLGQVVATLADREEFTSGENWVEFDAASMATGVYYYRIDVNDGQYKDLQKMVLIK